AQPVTTAPVAHAVKTSATAPSTTLARSYRRKRARPTLRAPPGLAGAARSGPAAPGACKPGREMGSAAAARAKYDARRDSKDEVLLEARQCGVGFGRLPARASTNRDVRQPAPVLAP